MIALVFGGVPPPPSDPEGGLLGPVFGDAADETFTFFSLILNLFCSLSLIFLILFNSSISKSCKKLAIILFDILLNNE